MLELTTWDEVETVIKKSRIVLVAIYDSGNPMGRYISSLIDDISYYIEPAILVIKIDARTSTIPEKIGSVPKLQLYYNGLRIWEQIGFFYNPVSDKYAIRRGILYALRSRGLSPRNLGISLGF
ncbi:hypothetical protein PYJP_03640 [Pyrofollis japonicus]|uniref:hypothetical protein n=1 Tax=Pyrofollis japonicus TaxID=3060460 RepID=UPI00295C24B3|nr:hypothetical protein [Pyrofollis japonicus]BEP17012.1 hypothetical protein PYJP_03640 [Pyrofollis japonicus]